MFSGKEKQAGDNLVSAIISIHDERFREDFQGLLSNLQLSDIEFRRMIFCLYVLEISIAVFSVYLTERDIKKALEIIDNIFHGLRLFFSPTMGKTRLEDYPRIVDLIIDPTERTLISSIIAQKIDDFTRVSYDTLMLKVVDIRSPQYFEACRSNVREVLNKSTPNRLFDPLTELFIKHFTGKDALEFDIGSAQALSLAIAKRFVAISAITHGMISGKTQT
jgi:hypothetical protein